jgi:RteC protein
MKTQDLKAFTDQLHQKMAGQLESIRLESQDAIVSATNSLSVVTLCMKELKAFIHQYQFQSKQEEIGFFKQIKPVFSSQYLYHEKILSIKINEPIGSKDELLALYFDELKRIQDFINGNPEFNRYCLTNSTHLDEQYFTRGSNPTANPEADEEFSTGYDNTLAMLLANHLLKEYLIGTIEKIRTQPDGGALSSLAWTGPKTALIELIYALHSVEPFNNGKADIKQIAMSFENIFNISLGNYYRVFQEIRLRKTGRTNFLDQLKNKFIHRMDDLDQN